MSIQLALQYKCTLNKKYTLLLISFFTNANTQFSNPKSFLYFILKEEKQSFLGSQGRPEFSEVVRKLEECLCNVEVSVDLMRSLFKKRARGLKRWLRH